MTTRIIKSRELYPPWQKPLRGTLIDSTHPLGQGMNFALPMNEQSGTTIYDVAGGLACTLESGAVWTPGGDIACRVSTSYIKGPISGKVIKPKGSIFIRYWNRENKHRYKYWFTLDDTYTDFTSYDDNAIAKASFRINSSSGLILDPPKTRVHNDGDIHTIALTWDADTSLRRFFIDGKLEYDGNLAFTWNAADFISTYLSIGGRSVTADRECEGDLSAFYIWDGRVLNLDEAIWLHREPYAMFQRFRPYNRHWHKKKLGRVR